MISDVNWWFLEKGSRKKAPLEKLEKYPEFFYLPFFFGTNLPKTGQVLALTGTGLNLNRDGF